MHSTGSHCKEARIGGMRSYFFVRVKILAAEFWRRDFIPRDDEKQKQRTVNIELTGQKYDV